MVYQGTRQITARVHVTGASHLEAGVPEKIIKERTGHMSLQGSSTHTKQRQKINTTVSVILHRHKKHLPTIKEQAALEQYTTCFRTAIQ